MKGKTYTKGCKTFSFLQNFILVKDIYFILYSLLWGRLREQIIQFI
jgi:hypothetical protein